MSRNIRWGKVVRVSNDAGPYKLVTVECDGAEYECIAMDHGGFSAAPIADSQAMVFLPDGDEGKAAAMVMPPPAERVDGQKPGMMTAKNHAKGQNIVLDDDGNIVLNGPVIIKGDITIDGNITQTGDFSQSGVHTDSNGPHTA